MVKLTAAKCPSCGADIQVNEALENTICQYCGTTVLIQEAIEKYKVELSGKIEVEGINSNTKKIENAKKHMALGEYKQAQDLFNQVNNDDSFNIESQSLWIKNAILLTKLKENYFEKNFIREDYSGICNSTEMIIKHFDRLKKFDEAKEYEKYIKDELPILDYIKKEYEELVADEKELKDIADKLWSSYDFDIRMIIITNQLNIDASKMSWVNTRVNIKPPSWTTSIPYRFSGIKITRNGMMVVTYKSIDYDYWSSYYFKPEDGPYTKEQTIEKTNKILELISDGKFIKSVNKKLQKEGGYWYKVNLNKKSLFEKLGF